MMRRSGRAAGLYAVHITYFTSTTPPADVAAYPPKGPVPGGRPKPEARDMPLRQRDTPAQASPPGRHRARAEATALPTLAATMSPIASHDDHVRVWPSTTQPAAAA